LNQSYLIEIKNTTRYEDIQELGGGSVFWTQKVTMDIKTNRCYFFLLFLSVSLLTGQTRVRLSSQAQDFDFSLAERTRPAKTGETLPSTCAVGDLFYRSSAQAGENLHGCTSQNVWTILGSMSMFQLPSVTMSSGSVLVGKNCLAATCSLRFGAAVYFYSTLSTAALPVGSGGASTVFLYVRANGIRYLGVNGSAVTGATLSNLVLESGITSFPPEAFPLATCQAAGGAFTSCIEYRASGRDLLESADSSIVISNGGNGRQLIAVNPASVLATTANSDLSGRNKVNYQALSTSLPNHPTAGTVANRLVALSGGVATVAPVGADRRVVGVCSNNCGVTGTARVTTRGQVPCTFDGATTAGDYVKPSATLAGYCTSAGAVRPLTGPVLGFMLSTQTGSGTYDMLLESDGGNPESGNRPLDYSYLATFLPNDASTPTTPARLVMLTATGTVQLAPAGAAARVLGICLSGCGNSGQARVVTRGTTTCAFDGAAVVGHYVRMSDTVAGGCMDAGASRPASGAVLGYILSALAGSGNGTVLLEPDIH
jgi:hypothetical protein